MTDLSRSAPRLLRRALLAAALPLWLVGAWAQTGGPRDVTPPPEGQLKTTATDGAGPLTLDPIARRKPPLGYEEIGLASWYGHPYHGRETANGETYDMMNLTAAHQRIAFGTWLSVENLTNGRSVSVRINDRGPFVDPRILDLSYAAASVVNSVGAGVVPVRLRVIAEPTPPPGPRTPVLTLSPYAS